VAFLFLEQESTTAAASTQGHAGSAGLQLPSPLVGEGAERALASEAGEGRLKEQPLTPLVHR